CIAETPLAEPPAFANHYEWSKWRAERTLVDEHGCLPWSILRIATVIAADEQGEVRQYNAFHNTLKLLFYGLVSLIPGRREAPLYVVTEAFALGAAMAVLGTAERHGVYHACHRRDESLALGELLGAAYRRFAADEDFAARRILEPLFCDEESFALLAAGVDGFGGQVVRQGLASIVPFAAQLFSDKSFDNARLAEVMAGACRAPDPLALVAATCDYLVRTRWGTRLEHAA
ncbi:MAG: SDR family oxidoreductase, partial [Gammaproteobacteria bacterium]|nr:SDR family oxidoreductase [Gammaproteobacteria bacterium]